MPKVSAEYREQRRREIVDAAVDCFARKGFHQTSMQDIVAASGLSPGAIYRYFAGKEEIVQAIADERHAREAALLETALAAGDLRSGLHELTRAYFDWLRDPEERLRRRLEVQVWAESLHNERMAATITRGGADARAAWSRAIADEQRRGNVVAGVEPEAVARLMLAVLQGFILQQGWEPDADIDAYVEVVDALVDRFFETP